MLNRAKIYRKAFFCALRPDPILSISDWSDRYRQLSQKASPEPGRWRTSRTPYLKEIMDEISPSSGTETAVFMKGSQIGGSECGFNWLGYIIDWCPGPTMMVQPTVSLAERNSKQRIDPMIDETPRLREKVHESKSRDSGNTILSKEFPGGILVMGGANSAAGLSNMPVKNLFLDEVDRYPIDADGEGDPIALAIGRTKAFARRKIFIVSTPNLEATSRIAKEYEASDRRKYYVPCPHCGHMQVLQWERIHYPKDNPRAAHYVCEGCEKVIEEHFKTQMLENGKWIAENPGASESKVAGFHLSALYSPIGWFSWGRAAEEYEAAKDDPAKMKVFVNTVLGLTYKEKGDAPDWKRIYDVRETYAVGSVPEGVVFLTAGADVQKDRIEYEVVGWGPGKESWSIEYRVISGDTQTSAPWDELGLALHHEYEHASGTKLGIEMLAIDSGSYTQTVYNWVRLQPPRRVIASKGSDEQPTILGRPSKVDVNLRGQIIRRGLMLWHLGSSVAKSELYGMLRLEKPLDGQPYPAGYCHFPEYGEDYFKQLTAEQVVVRKVRGYSKHVWEKIRERNEALDCRVLARLAAAARGIDRFTPAHWAYKADLIGAKMNTHLLRQRVGNESGETNSAGEIKRRQRS